MNEKNTRKLYKDFPSLFSYKGEPTLSFGLECSDGWFKLIYKLCEDIKSKGGKLIITQIKEKFGGLRFYTSSTTKEIFDLIHKAEDNSYKICEFCGGKGKLRNDLMWIKTLCNECYHYRLTTHAFRKEK